MKSHSMPARFSASKEEITQRAEGISGGLCLENPRKFMAIQGEMSFLLEQGYKNIAILCGNDPEEFQECIATAFGGTPKSNVATQTHKTTRRSGLSL